MLAAEFPEELVVEILTRLPVKPLLKFRCVSKPWRSLIDSSSFLKLHLSKNRNSEIYVFDDPRCGSIDLAEVDLTFKAEVDSVNSYGLLFQSHKFPVSSPLNYTEVVGSRDGLICLWTSFSEEIVLVNPSTREYRLLPPISKQFRCFVALGIGYDSPAEEYKVVLIPETRKKLYIYGSKSNSWRYVDVSTEYTSSIDRIDRTFGSNGVYIHGALHWTMCSSEHRFWIVAFDLFSEKFTVVEYNGDFFGKPDYVKLKVAGGQLCLFCRHDLEKEDEEKDYTVIWMMEEYGVRESWSILASIDGYAEPLALSTCAKRLLVRGLSRLPRVPTRNYRRDTSLHWYDLDKKFMGVAFTTSKELSSLYVCQQSLIRLEGKLG